MCNHILQFQRSSQQEGLHGRESGKWQRRGAKEEKGWGFKQIGETDHCRGLGLPRSESSPQSTRHPRVHRVGIERQQLINLSTHLFGLYVRLKIKMYRFAFLIFVYIWQALNPHNRDDGQRWFVLRFDFMGYISRYIFHVGLCVNDIIISTQVPG